MSTTGHSGTVSAAPLPTSPTVSWTLGRCTKTMTPPKREERKNAQELETISSGLNGWNMFLRGIVHTNRCKKWNNQVKLDILFPLHSTQFANKTNDNLEFRNSNKEPNHPWNLEPPPDSSISFFVQKKSGYRYHCTIGNGAWKILFRIWSKLPELQNSLFHCRFFCWELHTWSWALEVWFCLDVKPWVWSVMKRPGSKLRLIIGKTLSRWIYTSCKYIGNNGSWIFPAASSFPASFPNVFFLIFPFQLNLSLVVKYARQIGSFPKIEVKFKNNETTTWQFFVTFMGWLSDPLQWLSDLQLGDEKVTLNHHLVAVSCFLSCFVRGQLSCLHPPSVSVNAEISRTSQRYTPQD